MIKRSHINELMNLQPVYKERDLDRLRHFYDMAETHFRGLDSMMVDETTYSCVVVPLLLDKLPEAVQLSMLRAVRGAEDLSLSCFLEVLRNELEVRESHVSILKPNLAGSPGMQTMSASGKGKDWVGTSSALHSVAKDHRCAFCLKFHEEIDCQNVKDFSERKNIVKKYGRCFICLAKGHLSFKCRRNMSCSICKGRHHSALCEQGNANSTACKDVGKANTNTCVESVECGGRVALQTAQGYVNGTRNVKVRVLFDGGSHRSFVTSNVVNKAGIFPSRKENLRICRFGETNVDVSAKDIVQINLSSVDKKYNIPFEACVVDSISQLENQHLEIVKKDFVHLKDIWFSDVDPKEEQLSIQILIGADYMWRFMEDETRKGDVNEPVAVRTKLGWVLSGPVKGEIVDVTSVSNVNINFISDKETNVLNDKASLQDQIHKLWDLDSVGVRPTTDVHEDIVDKIEFTGERYSTKLPWKEAHKPLPTNYGVSVARLKGQLSKLKKSPEVLQEYDNIIKDQLERGIVEKVVGLDNSSNVHYLPHHAVIREEAETTKLRIVYDASCREKHNGTSLNDCLHVGPSLNPLLFDLLVSWRHHQIALVADIEKAFLNIEVHPDDRNCLRFLWVNDVSSQSPSIETYRFNRVVFGVNSSPFLLNAVLRHHIDKYAEVDPQFVSHVRNEFYVDDLASGAKNVTAAVELYYKVKNRMAEGGFHLRKWKTNEPEVAKVIESESIQEMNFKTKECDNSYAKTILNEGKDIDSSCKVLGIHWNQREDTLQFEFSKIASELLGKKVTKRGILSFLAKTFDPLGVLSPILINGKFLFQELCVENIGWDDELPPDKLERWNNWLSSLINVGSIVIPRCLYGKNAGEILHCSLHGFADASLKGYCATVYFVYETKEGVFSQLVCSKTRVAPLKALSIPRLELMSARILATLMKTVSSALSSYCSIEERYLWLDSKTALFWINNRNEWKQFVQYRVYEILRLSSSETLSRVETLSR